MNHSLAQLDDDALLAEVKRLVQCERETTATLVAHLAEVDGRRLYNAQGCSTMFMYCTEVLRMSEHATFLRLRAARAVQLYPRVLVELASGALNLSSIKLLEPYLTQQNEKELLEAARHKSKREVEKLIRSRHPLPDVPDVVRKLPVPRVGEPAILPKAADNPAAVAMAASCDGSQATEELRLASARAAGIQERSPSLVAPLAPERYKVQFTASEVLHDKLRRAQSLLRHRIPDGDLSQVFELALTALVEQLEKQKLAATDRPCAGRVVATGSRVIPAEVKRTVYKRDGGQCAFVGRNDRRCSETGFLEFHHVVPFARGGEATTNNIALRCRAHNQYEALLDFGPRDLPVVRESPAPWGEFVRD